MAAGLTVATTASAPNHDLVKSLGAKYIFDHKDLHVIKDILKVLKVGDVVVDCISSKDTQETCIEIVSKLGGGKLPVLRWPEASKHDDVEMIFGESHSIQQFCMGFY